MCGREKAREGGERARAATTPETELESKRAQEGSGQTVSGRMGPPRDGWVGLNKTKDGSASFRSSRFFELQHRWTPDFFQ